MTVHAESIRLYLQSSPRTTRQIVDLLGISQPTVSRSLAALGGEIVRFSIGRTIHHALHNTRQLPDIPIYRVNAVGQIQQLGVLCPVYPNGFVMQQADGVTRHSDGLPWWLFDMRPQGYLGRAFASRHGAQLYLPERLSDWSDTHALHALLVHGHDVIGNLLLGEKARNAFLASPVPDAIQVEQKPVAYSCLALAAANGEAAGSSAGGEQPKFTAYVATSQGARHVIVKFTECEQSPISERWRDLLLCEHLALNVLSQAGIAAAQSQIIDYEGQRFLELIRFDRVDTLGRCAVFSLAALDAEFVGNGLGGWAAITQQLAANGEITSKAAAGAGLLAAFGALIGNTDMHSGNLSFVSEHGRPYQLAPAYDMVPMGFAPRSGGGLSDTLPPANIRADISSEAWRHAAQLAQAFLMAVESNSFSERFQPCINTLRAHISSAAAQIARLG